MGQISVTQVTLVHCGVVVPPIHNTRSWQTFTELCCLVCQQYFASKALQRRYHCFKHCSSTCEKRDWCESESELESELESESIFPSRSRSRSRSHWNLVDSAALVAWAGLRRTWNRSQRALNVVSEGSGAVYEEPKVCEPIFKGPGSVLKGHIPVLETVQTRLVLKRPQRALNRRTLDRYHRALDSWSQRALDRVLEWS